MPASHLWPMRLAESPNPSSSPIPRGPRMGAYGVGGDLLGP